MSKKSNREKYIEIITDAIIDFRVIHNSKNPEYVVMTSALFKAIAGSKANRERAKFGVVKIKVYDDDAMNFFLIEKIYETRENNE